MLQPNTGLKMHLQRKASQDDDSGTEIGWFNAFKVSDNPNDQLLIINMIEDVKDRGGSHYLLPKVKTMFE